MKWSFVRLFRHPQPFSLICKTCLAVRLPALRIEAWWKRWHGTQLAARQRCQIQDMRRREPGVARCRSGGTEILFCAMRSGSPSRRTSGWIYARRRASPRRRGRSVFGKARRGRKELGYARARCRECCSRIRNSSQRPSSCFQRGCERAVAAERQIAKGDDREALMSGSAANAVATFFNDTARVRDTEGKKSSEFADEERAHLELLISEYRSIHRRQRRRTRADRASGRRDGPHAV